MEPNPEISIIGTGAAGSSLIKCLSVAGYKIRSVISRQSADEIRNRLGDNINAIRIEELKNENVGRVLIISIPDDFLSGMDKRLSAFDIDWQDRVVAHCSGFHSSDVLKNLNRKGATVAAFHPLQTFVGRSGSGKLKDIHISIEGDDEALGILMSIALHLHAKPILLSREQKAVLHVAAVFVSNYLVSLGSIADTLLKKNIPGAEFKMLIPLMLQTVRNLEETQPSEALSGPVARGDVQTVENHLQLLKNEKEIQEIYRLLGREAIKLAKKRDGFSIEIMEELLSD